MKLYPKIDIYLKSTIRVPEFRIEWSYFASTNQFRTCKEAREAFIDKYPIGASKVKAIKAK